jgi:hypothetical protein
MRVPQRHRDTEEIEMRTGKDRKQRMNAVLSASVPQW